MSYIKAKKSQLRLNAKAKRAHLFQNVDSAPENLIKKSFKNLQKFGASNIAGYWPIADELDVRPLMRKLSFEGVTVSLPAVIPGEKKLVFRVWVEGTPLLRGPYGTWQLAENTLLNEPDVLLIPLLAFDSKGGRLGYGGGFYDQTVSALRKQKEIISVGIAYSGQEITEVPMCMKDQRLDWIATELGMRGLRAQCMGGSFS